jgi:ElaB/YqjD/DUF883 family membrane-anchored ribosome-binding protein
MASEHDSGTPAPKHSHERIERGAERFKSATSETIGRTHDAVDRVEQGMHHATDRVAGAAERAADRAADAEARTQEAIDHARQQAEDWWQTARGYVREKPAQSVAIAVAAGWLLGRLTRR